MDVIKRMRRWIGVWNTKRLHGRCFLRSLDGALVSYIPLQEDSRFPIQAFIILALLLDLAYGAANNEFELEVDVNESNIGVAANESGIGAAATKSDIGATTSCIHYYMDWNMLHLLRFPVFK